MLSNFKGLRAWEAKLTTAKSIYVLLIFINNLTQNVLLAISLDVSYILQL